MPEISSQDRVEADRWFVEHKQLRLAEQGCRQRDAGALTAGHLANGGVGALGEIDQCENSIDLAYRDAEDRSEVVKVLANREVEVDAGSLGHVADAMPQVRVTGGQSEHFDVAATGDLNAHDASHEGRLAAAGGSEQTGDAACLDLEIEAGENQPAASLHD